MKKIIAVVCTISSPLILSQTAFAYDFFSTDGSFKRFSISAGWLHAMPQGKANNFHNSTAISEGYVAGTGDIKASSVVGALDTSASSYTTFKTLLSGLGSTNVGSLAGDTTIYGLSNWESENTGLEAEDVDTLGIMMNYHFTDHWSMEIKAGIPPKVNIDGKGYVYAPFSGSTSVSLLGVSLGSIILKKDIPITDLTQGNGVAATARAWLPAAEIHYQFGRSGVNKFRPYIGVGVIYAYFNDIELNKGIESDLIAAGHMIQNIKDNKAGAALEGATSSGTMKVKVDADDAFGPIATLGATYDFNDRWFAVASVSYSKLSSYTTITVNNETTGEELIRAKSKIDIDPIITYAGIGYRF